ncbi:hypothetical protein CFC21_087926 [Triticum aestivum]|uniref:Cytochrome P450 n=2 Tax=Triticum aestivum TaxID=4565 RepID=A0A3B6PK91_WHEAT|nr:zealexin A1 synthase-like [Triticum aestivum]KAF7084259.1 hypothetical protein CFC21_087926 [Triticum aestivum]
MAMVRQVASWFCVILALLLPCLLLKLWKRRDTGVAKLPPSPWRLPVVGNLHQVIIHGPLLHRAIADLAHRLDAPLMYLQLGEVPVVVASSPDAAREVTKTHDLSFATRPWRPSMRILLADGDAPGLVFAPYGALWRQLRKTSVLELLSARRVRSFRRVREEEVGRLVASLAACSPGQTVDVGERLTALMTDAVLRTMIGDRFDQRDEFLEVLAEALKIAAGFSLGDLFPSWKIVNLLSGTARRAEANARKMFELMDCVIRQHQERSVVEDVEEDMVDVLLRLQKEDGLEVPLTMGAIKSLIRDIFSAGSETSATTVQWAMAELMRNPGAMQKAQAELRDTLQGSPTVTEDDLTNLSYLKLVIKETLRLHPAVPLLLPRECRETCKVMGYDVPKGTTVFVNVWAIGRDNKYWADAEVFKPERFESGPIDFKGTDFEFLPFGAGRRMCPGMTFAQHSMELALASLLYHFDWELPLGVSRIELNMAEELSITIQRKNGLHLRPVVRVPLQADL